jgi:trans-AT polyketide synthase/acyltransferase/oxidoreductase domain-containing protein
MSETVKNMLQEINVQDTDYAPAGDMFKIGARVQVLKKGTFFPARANKLFMLYNHYNSLDEIPEKIRDQIQKQYFKKSFEEIFHEVKEHLTKTGRSHLVEEALNNSKYKMELVFVTYFHRSMLLSFGGDIINQTNFQVHTGPALGAFNQWVKGTKFENWRNRHVDDIANKLMSEAAMIINQRYTEYCKK